MSTSTVLTGAPVVSARVPAPQTASRVISNPSKPTLYLAVFAFWFTALAWFHPRLWSLLDMADTPLKWASLAFFVVFVEFAWLYGIYNLTVVLFAVVHRLRKKTVELPTALTANHPPVAILYTTCNDFVWESAASCVDQDYPDFRVYMLDDSTDEASKAEVDRFAAAFPERVEVVRRPDRKAFKAGNMNHGLAHAAVSEPYFAIADADEILPPDFLSRLVPIMENDPACGFIQANHRANPNQKSQLAQDLGVGIDLHWSWYQPLRNTYGFVMFLGHGALLRRVCWEEIGGFPDIVSEDLGFAIRAREKGYRGRFVEDVMCFEDFPDSVRSFRIRHMKWTRGTCEFLYKEALPLLGSRNIPWAEKLDILFPTLNLPLTLFYLLFMFNANLLIPALWGKTQMVTLAAAGREWALPVMALDAGFNVVFEWDFFLITLATFFAPVLCFLFGLAHQPLRLFRFLSHSTALYASLGPLSSIGVLSFAVTRKAIFLVTGEKKQSGKKESGKNAFVQLKEGWSAFWGKSHPDHWVIQATEVAMGIGFAWISIKMMQVSFLGLCLAFILLPLMHRVTWEHSWVRKAVYIPFALLLIGLGIGGMSAMGLSTVFFGFGFHF